MPTIARKTGLPIGSTSETSRSGLVVKLVRALALKGEQLARRSRRPVDQQLGRAHSKPVEIFPGKVDPAAAGVFTHVAQNVRELKRQSRGFRQALGLAVL